MGFKIHKTLFYLSKVLSTWFLHRAVFECFGSKFNLFLDKHDKFCSGNLSSDFFNISYSFKLLIHESFKEISPTYHCLTDKAEFSKEMELRFVYLGENSCHNFYCAHIFCGKICLFFLFSGRITRSPFPTTLQRHCLLSLVKLLKN